MAVEGSLPYMALRVAYARHAVTSIAPASAAGSNVWGACTVDLWAKVISKDSGYRKISRVWFKS